MATQDDLGGRMITGDPAGERIALTLEVIDGAGDPLTDAMVEIWQAGPDGTYGPTDGFTHWGRQPADAQTGQMMFETLMPGAPAGQVPHILVWVAAHRHQHAFNPVRRGFSASCNNLTDPIFVLAGDRCLARLLLRRPLTAFTMKFIFRGRKKRCFSMSDIAGKPCILCCAVTGSAYRANRPIRRCRSQFPSKR
ncbi:MAG: hypothetical protein U5K75_03895 [Ahrensia sp.]|nr:hypothetical protein [Ahrensia sp.]